MRLSDRLEHRQSSAIRASMSKDRKRTSTDRNSDPLATLKARVQAALFARLGTRLYDSSLTEDKLLAFVQQELAAVVAQEEAPLSREERQTLVRDVSNDVMGYGPIAEFLDDDTVSEIMVNSLDAIYVEREGQLHQTYARFLSEDHLRRIIERIVAQVGRRIDESAPMVDARLPDGSRVNAVIPPLAVDGPALTIRKFARDAFQVDDLIGFGTLTAEVADLLRACVVGRLNILVSGGTGTGKTTLLNVLSSYVPNGQRIVTIEDAVELQLRQDHVVRLESRPTNIEGKGEVSIRDLVRNSLRMRPDRIIVGEVRSGETLDMLQAMNTGHEGSLSTVHANTPRDAITRMETMVLMAGMELPIRAVREQIAAAIDLIVHLNRMRDGTRRVTTIAEVQGMQGEVVTLQDIFTFDYDAGVDEHGRYLGRLRPTGLRPGFAERLSRSGVELGPLMFGGLAGIDRATRR
ncbi:MAG: CpaF family protein [Actinobacteria bacterium]|nr:CpaF family protein [Actinomycetota bacterium]